MIFGLTERAIKPENETFQLRTIIGTGWSMKKICFGTSGKAWKGGLKGRTYLYCHYTWVPPPPPRETIRARDLSSQPPNETGPDAYAYECGLITKFHSSLIWLINSSRRHVVSTEKYQKEPVPLRHQIALQDDHQLTSSPGTTIRFHDFKLEYSFYLIYLHVL